MVLDELLEPLLGPSTIDTDPVYFMGVPMPVARCECDQTIQGWRGTSYRWLTSDYTTKPTPLGVLGPYRTEIAAAKAYVRAMILTKRYAQIPRYRRTQWDLLLRANDQYKQKRVIPGTLESPPLLVIP